MITVFSHTCDGQSKNTQLHVYLSIWFLLYTSQKQRPSTKEVSFLKVQEKKTLLYTKYKEACQEIGRMNRRVKRNWAEVFSLIFLRQNVTAEGK